MLNNTSSVIIVNDTVPVVIEGNLTIVFGDLVIRPGSSIEVFSNIVIRGTLILRLV
jgi:hypothetical protein